MSDRNVSPESSVHEEQVRWGWWGGPRRRWLPWRSKPAGSPGGEQLMITDSSLRKFVWIQRRPQCLFWPGLIRFSNLNVAARKVFRKVCSTFRRWHCQWPKNTRKKMNFQNNDFFWSERHYSKVRYWKKRNDNHDNDYHNLVSVISLVVNLERDHPLLLLGLTVRHPLFSDLRCHAHRPESNLGKHVHWAINSWGNKKDKCQHF